MSKFERWWHTPAETAAPVAISDKTYTLESFVVNSGNRMSSTADVVLMRGGKRYQEVALGTEKEEA